MSTKYIFIVKLDFKKSLKLFLPSFPFTLCKTRESPFWNFFHTFPPASVCWLSCLQLSLLSPKAIPKYQRGWERRNGSTRVVDMHTHHLHKWSASTHACPLLAQEGMHMQTRLPTTSVAHTRSRTNIGPRPRSWGPLHYRTPLRIPQQIIPFHGQNPKGDVEAISDFHVQFSLDALAPSYPLS